MYRALNPGMVNIRADFEQVLRLARRNGFGAVEYNPSDIEAEVGLERALDLMGQNGVILSSFGLPVNFQGGAEAFGDSFAGLEATARRARALGCHRAGTYVFSWSDELDFAENYQLHTRRLRLCAQVLAEYDISLGLEFLGPKTLRDGHRYGFIHTLAGMLELADAIGTGNVGIMLDAYHCYTAGMAADAFAGIVRSQSDITVVHINDAPAGQPLDTLPDTQRYLPGEGGGMDVAGFLKALAALGYTGPVICEPFSERLKAMDDAGAIAAAVKASFDTVWPGAEAETA